jgi:hypothetical protein
MNNAGMTISGAKPKKIGDKPSQYHFIYCEFNMKEIGIELEPPP